MTAATLYILATRGILPLQQKSIEFKAIVTNHGCTPKELEAVIGSKKGKAKAQKALYTLYYSYALSITLRYCYNREEALEVLNDSFLKVFNNIKAYNVEQPFKSWFSRIVVNTSIDSFRKQKKHQYLTDIEEAAPETLDATAVSNLTETDILKLLEHLPEIYRITFNLYEIEGFSHDEIASQLGITASTSRANLTRAKAKIRVLYHRFFQTSHA
jgi:RNA polymerase sigma-70 factor (ECF subfamily)